MGGYIARRLGSTLVVMAIVGAIVFLLVHLAPGSPAAIIAGDNASPAQIDMMSRCRFSSASGRGTSCAAISEPRSFPAHR